MNDVKVFFCPFNCYTKRHSNSVKCFSKINVQHQWLLKTHELCRKKEGFFTAFKMKT